MTATVKELKEKAIKLERRVNAAVEENFGYCPNEPWFDNLLEERKELRDEIWKNHLALYTELKELGIY